jgi:rod shape-determining protein MreD
VRPPVKPEKERYPAREAAVALALAALLFVAVVAQFALVNRLPFPTGALPDVVLLLCAAVAVHTTPARAALFGFAGGLGLDAAPPADHYAGEYALVFCLVCYFAARGYRAFTSATGNREPVAAVAAMALAVAAGEAGKAALGLLLSDPDVTPGAVARLLPGALLYDVVLAPFVFLLVGWLMHRTRPRREPALHENYGFTYVFRNASQGAVPKLRLAGTGMAFTDQPPGSRFANRQLANQRAVPRLRLSGTGRGFNSPVAARRTPRLKLSGTGRDYSGPAVSHRAIRLRLAGIGALYAGAPYKGSVVAGRTPKLRLSGTGADYGRKTARRVPRLRLSGTGRDYSGPVVSRRAARLRLAGTGALHASSAAPLPAGRRKRLNFGGDLPVRIGGRPKSAPGKGWLRAADSPALAGQPRGRRPARLAFGRRSGGMINGRAAAGWGGGLTGGLTAGWASGLPGSRASGFAGGLGPGRGSGFARGLRGARGSSLAGRLAAARDGGRRDPRTPKFGSGTLAAGGGGRTRHSSRARVSFNWSPARPSVIPFIPQPHRTAAEALAARSAPSGLSALAGHGTPMGRVGRRGRAPQRGWLRGTRRTVTPAASGPRSGWLGGNRRSRTVIGSAPGGRPRTYTSTPTRAWAHRSRSPWRRRTRRLLKMMGVGE